MADTQRTLTAILALLADNTTGDISPQDVRDMLVSSIGRCAQISVPAANRAAVTIAGTVNYYEATAPTWVLGSFDALFDQSSGNGRLKYLGVVAADLHIACTISLTCGSNNQVIHARLGKNGVSDAASEVQFKLGTVGDVASTALHLIATVSPGDYISLFVRNETGANNVTVECANLQAVLMPR